MRNALLLLALVVTGCGQSPLQATDATPTPNQSVQVLAFGAVWCGPCQADKAKLIAWRDSGAPVLLIDVDQHADTADAYQVDKVPTYVMEIDRVEVGRVHCLRDLWQLWRTYIKGVGK